MPTKLKLISLFSGCGGMDYGFEAAGFETAVALEMDHSCCETLRKNRSWPVIEGDIFSMPTPRILAEAGLKRGAADLLIGGPPCQPFSKSGYWAKGDSARLKDPRADTLAAFMRVVEEAQPRAFVLENVTGLAYANKDEGLQYLLSQITAINRRIGTNYRAHYTVLKAAEFGVPQIRERFFLVAARDGAYFEFPQPLFCAAAAREETGGMFKPPPLPTYRTAWDAIGDLPVSPKAEILAMTGRWADLLASIPEGNNYLWHTDRGGGLPLFGWRRRFWNFLLKLAKDRPSWTIQAQPGPSVGPFHWDNRRLSIRELCRLQTFPDDIEVTGNHRTAHKQIGNAVPSLLAEIIGRKVRTELLGAVPLSRPLKLLPLDRSPAPRANAIKPVLAKYLSLVGDQSAHPGTGKGYAAQAGFRVSA